ncbi:MAG: DUF711 family protein [Promethearchaeota archaeon]
MKIRAITFGIKVPYFKDITTFKSMISKSLTHLSEAHQILLKEFEKNNLEVETVRICTQPVISNENDMRMFLNKVQDVHEFNEKIKILQTECTAQGFHYFASCAMLADRLINIKKCEPFLTSTLPTILKSFDNFFTSLQVSSTAYGLNLKGLKYCCKIIKSISYPNPFNNLKFCVSSNVPPNTPFFPAAYHASEHTKFSLALEMADEVVKIFENYNSLTLMQQDLKKKFNEIYNELIEICENTIKKSNVKFHGIDFSPAPYPTLKKSIGTAIEKLNFDHFGCLGSLIGVALIKNCIPKKEKVIGFSGFMQPVLEDFIISKRVSEGKVSLESLLLNSVVCGTGLDCVPLPGDISERELFYILLDLCTLSQSLNKPLTARLMPIEGKSPGDEVDFDFEYFARSKVMNVPPLMNIKKNDLFYQDDDFFKFRE